MPIPDILDLVLFAFVTLAVGVMCVRGRGPFVSDLLYAQRPQKSEGAAKAGRNGVRRAVVLFGIVVLTAWTVVAAAVAIDAFPGFPPSIKNSPAFAAVGRACWAIMGLALIAAGAMAIRRRGVFADQYALQQKAITPFPKGLLIFAAIAMGVYLIFVGIRMFMDAW